jgi:hypothetical protein
MLSVSFSSIASICGTENQKLLWHNDEIISQYECDNAKTKTCVSKAVWGYDNSQYVVLAGKVDTTIGHPVIYSFARVSGGKEGRVFETNQILGLIYTPSSIIILDSSKFRFTLVIDKNSGRAKYSEEFKKGYISAWQTSVSENLKCKKINH